MKEIYLNGRKNEGIHKTKVSDEDYEWLMQWKWRVLPSGNKLYAGRSVNYIRENGKRSVYSVWMHRVILGIEKGSNIVGDHIDGDPLNNQRENLRTATPQQNTVNRKRNKEGTSKYKGVCQVTETKRIGYGVKAERQYYWWLATCSNNGKQKVIRCKTEIEAALAYNEMAIKYHGEYAKLNIITDESNMGQTEEELKNIEKIQIEKDFFTNKNKTT